METKKITVEQATREWVTGFNAISSSLIKRAFQGDIDNWYELTPIVAGDYVYYNGSDEKVVEVRLEKTYDGVDFNNSKVILDLEEVKTISLSNEEIDFIYVDGEKVEVDWYDFDNNVFVLENDTEVSFTDVSKVAYLGLDANVLNIKECDNDFEFELELAQTIVDYYDVDFEQDGWLPMWGTLWTFGESLDEEWARENPELLAQCGFRIFEDQEDGDIYIGIDGMGYNFYEAHWIPLYKARGLQWHNVE